MRKTMIGPRLRQLRRERDQTQAAMAKTLGVSTSYVNLLENNQRSLSVQMLMALSEAYNVDWRELVKDEASNRLADLRSMFRDPVFGKNPPDLQELRGAIDHAPRLTEQLLGLYKSHRAALDQMMRLGSDRMPDAILQTSPETIIHDFFRDHSNYFHDLELAAEVLRGAEPCDADEVYTVLKSRMQQKHGVSVQTSPIDDMKGALRFFDEEAGAVFLSQALDYPNRTFQLAHVLCLVEFPDVLRDLTKDLDISSQAGISRCTVELANYFAAAVLTPYAPFLAEAERTQYDVDRLAAAFDVSFEQASHRLTTLQREGNRGVPFFFLRIDRAGNVTKRFNATSFSLAEHGGSCPVWNIHTAFNTPGQIRPQFVELPDGERFFTISRTVDRPVLNRNMQDQRLAIALGCELRHARRIGYAAPYNTKDDQLFHPIGINCHVCPRQACAQRANQPLLVELPIDPKRRGNTRYES